MSVLALKNKIQNVPLSLQSRAVGAYLGMAVGDALGATVEFMMPKEIQATHGIHHEIIGGGWLHLKPGQVTDDTTMALALGRSILQHKKVDAVAAASAFDDWMRGKPVDIGNTVRRGIVNFRQTGNPVSPVSEHDAGNGACMRCLPVALCSFNGLIDPITGNAAQAHVTHNNPVSDAATECVIAMIHASFTYQSLITQRETVIEKLISRYPKFKFESGRVENPTGYIVDTMKAVFQALYAQGSFEAAMIDVVNRGGDSDTTGAILGMIAGAYYGEESIPKRWLKKLDKNVLDECKSQAVALIRMGAD